MIGAKITDNKTDYVYVPHWGDCRLAIAVYNSITWQAQFSHAILSLCHYWCDCHAWIVKQHTPYSSEVSPTSKMLDATLHTCT